MQEIVVPVMYWILFSIGGLAIAARLLDVFWKNLQMTDARWRLDRGIEEGLDHEIYMLSLASGRLASWAGVLAAALILPAFAGAVGGAWVKIAALAVSVVLALAADRLRARHGRLESRFEQSVGESLEDFHRRIGEDAVRA